MPRGELVGYDSKARQFVPYLGGISAEGVNFSRDGEWVAYTSFPEGMLWRSRADGSERLQLSYPPMRAFLPRWSPDSRRIAFMAQLPSKPWKVFVVSAEGGAPQQLIPGEEGNEADPCWSPDGNSLTFDTLERSGIHILDLRTHQLSTLRGSDTFWNPLWSPDGLYMAATTQDSQRLLLFDFKRQNWTELAKVDVNYNYGNWSRDGRYLYFDTIFASEPAFFRLRISDRKLEQLVSLKGIRRAWGSFGPWSGLAWDDSPLLLRDVGSQEIYALDWEAP